MTATELQLLWQALNEECKVANIRLRKGEYQYNLAETIASYQLELHLPNVKEIIARSFGEEKVNDIQFTRKIQTILKKMEKGNVIKILPKKKPWELQRYMLLSFKFQDIDKNIVSFASENQINQVRETLNEMLAKKSEVKTRRMKLNFRILISMFTLALSYGIIVWDLLQPIIDPLIFVIALSVAIISSIALGEALV